MSWDEGLEPNSPIYGIAADPSLSIRVVAGPGTGKSFALKRRVARLLEHGASPRQILPVTFTNVAAEDLQREMMQIGVPGCTEIRGSTLHALGMRILGRQNVLEATGRVARPLNRFEIEPLLYDLPAEFGAKPAREKRIRAYEAAWSRLQHEEPGYAIDPKDQQFESTLVGWLRFHRGMLIGEIVPQLYQYLRDNPAAPEHSLYDYILVANALIGNNRDRDPRKLVSVAANGDSDIQIIQFVTLADEASGVARFIAEQIANHGRRPEDFLVLAQRRSIGNPIHDQLVTCGMPSKCYYHEGDLDSVTAQERIACSNYS